MGNGVETRVRLLSRLAGAALAVLLSAAVAAAAACREDTVHISGDFGAARFSVEVVRTPEDQARGLMFREDLPMSAGMIFAYETPRNVSFWMRNTLIPLDMIFIDETGTVSHIHANAVPLDETSIPSQGPVIAVLEINGGLSAQMGIAPGALVRHPAIPQDLARLPCE